MGFLTKIFITIGVGFIALMLYLSTSNIIDGYSALKDEGYWTSIFAVYVFFQVYIYLISPAYIFNGKNDYHIPYLFRGKHYRLLWALLLIPIAITNVYFMDFQGVSSSISGAESLSKLMMGDHTAYVNLLTENLVTTTLITTLIIGGLAAQFSSNLRVGNKGLCATCFSDLDSNFYEGKVNVGGIMYHKECEKSRIQR